MEAPISSVGTDSRLVFMNTLMTSAGADAIFWAVNASMSKAGSDSMALVLEAPGVPGRWFVRGLTCLIRQRML